MRHHHLDRATIALTAIVTFFTFITPARADGLAGVFHPAIGLPLTIGIGVLEGAILYRFVGAEHPYREAIIANLISAFVGWFLVIGVLLNDSLKTTAQSLLFVALLFVLTLVIEFTYLWLPWRKYGAKRLALGVLVANVASYVLLVPIAFASANFAG